MAKSVAPDIDGNFSCQLFGKMSENTAGKMSGYTQTRRLKRFLVIKANAGDVL